MQKYVARLVDINERLQEATNHLREQQRLVADIDCPRNHEALLMLLSNGLRVFCWLEDQRNGLSERIGEYMPMCRQ